MKDNMKAVKFKLDHTTSFDLEGFIAVLTNSGYSVTFDRKGTKALMARVQVTEASISDGLYAEDETEEGEADEIRDV